MCNRQWALRKGCHSKGLYTVRNSRAVKLDCFPNITKVSGHLSSFLIPAVSTYGLIITDLIFSIDFLRKSKGIHLRRKCHIPSMKGKPVSPDMHWENTPWRVGGERGNRGWDGWMASPTQRTWVCASSRRQWRTRKPGVLQSVSCQRVRQNLATEHRQTHSIVNHCNVNQNQPLLFSVSAFWKEIL